MLSSIIHGFRELARRNRVSMRKNRQLKEVERTKSRLYMMKGKLIRADELPLICTVSSTYLRDFKLVERKALAQTLFLSETGLREAGTEVVNRFVQILESGES